MSDISNAESSLLAAYAKHQAWMAKFMDQWFAPLRQTMEDVAVLSTPPEVLQFMNIPGEEGPTYGSD